MLSYCKMSQLYIVMTGQGLSVSFHRLISDFLTLASAFMCGYTVLFVYCMLMLISEYSNL